MNSHYEWKHLELKLEIQFLEHNMELLKQSVGDIIDLQYVENLLEQASVKQRPGS